jgi:hypothetical protein
MDTLTSGVTAPDRDGDWVAVDACTLPTAERPLRMAELDRLFATSLREVRREAGRTGHAGLVLVGDHHLAERVQRLVDAETSCCSFFSFGVTPLDAVGPADTSVVLDVSVPPDRTDVLEALVTRADAARQATS